MPNGPKNEIFHFFFQNLNLLFFKIMKAGTCVMLFIALSLAVCLAQWEDHQIPNVMVVGSNLTADNNFLLCRLYVVHVVSMSSLCRLYVISMSSLCRLYVVSLLSLCHFYVVSMSLLCSLYCLFVVSMLSLCHLRVVSMSSLCNRFVVSMPSVCCL